MIASPERKVLFVHVQKTGGSSIEAFLLARLPGAVQVKGLAGGRHATLRQAIRAQPDMAGYWSFGFVRNPWARMHSWHSMIVRRGEGARAGNPVLRERIRAPFWGGILERYPSFEEFVLDAPEEFDRLRRPQLDYLRAGRTRADFIGRTEQLDADLAWVCERLALPARDEAPRRNVGPTTNYREHYTPAMRDKVAKDFAPDIAEFGYEF